MATDHRALLKKKHFKDVVYFVFEINVTLRIITRLFFFKSVHYFMSLLNPNALMSDWFLPLCFVILITLYNHESNGDVAYDKKL